MEGTENNRQHLTYHLVGRWSEVERSQAGGWPGPELDDSEKVDAAVSAQRQQIK